MPEAVNWRGEPVSTGRVNWRDKPASTGATKMAAWHAQGSSRVPQPRPRFQKSGGLHRPPLRLLSPPRRAQSKQGKCGGRKPDRDALAAASAPQSRAGRFMLPQHSGK